MPATFPPTYASISADTLTFKPLAPLTFEALLSQEPSACTGTTTAPTQCASLNHKAIQELFTLDYGRMNATLGTELPNVNFLNQTTIPLGYVDPATEIVRQGDTQLWKITHNGVDTHFIHFHLFNVQVINRVGWDGSLRPPDANEMGWKDTVRMNPLEDIIVALQPITPQLPWPIPNSVRLNDVTGSNVNFTNLNPFSNGGANTADGPTNFGWEYVWHCHILGHEENDMMRPIMWQVPPNTPGPLTVAANVNGGVDISFTDNSASETGFVVQRSMDRSPVHGSCEHSCRGEFNPERHRRGSRLRHHNHGERPRTAQRWNDVLLSRPGYRRRVQPTSRADLQHNISPALWLVEYGDHLGCSYYRRCAGLANLRHRCGG